MEAEVRAFVEREWKENCIPKLEEYIRIPNLSPFFVDDKSKETAACNQDKAMRLLKEWAAAQGIQNMKMELVELSQRTPLLFMEVDPSADVDPAATGTVLLYGHMDKQPVDEPWSEGLAPYEPTIKDGKLYGRGGADDGYAIFCALTAIRALQQHGAKHARCVVIIEACEESGSPDLPFYIEHLRERIGTPNLIVCLDSGAGNYEQMWITTSLRGMCAGTLSVELLSSGVHSGDASGVVPDTFRIVRQLLDRVEDAKTGMLLLPELEADIPDQVREQVAKSASVLGEEGMVTCFPFVGKGQAVEVEDGKDRLTELALNRWWRAQLAYIGADGMPATQVAGNVLRAKTSLALSVRLAPTTDPKVAEAALTKALTEDVPYGATVSFQAGKLGRGWAAPPVAPWLDAGAQAASKAFFGKEAMYMGEGGSIPFMGMLGEMFPQAQFLIIGTLGPGSNAHGPDEFLHIDFSAKLTMCVAHVLKHHCEEAVEAKLQGAPEAKRRKTEDVAANFGRNEDGTKI